MPTSVHLGLNPTVSRWVSWNLHPRVHTAFFARRAPKTLTRTHAFQRHLARGALRSLFPPRLCCDQTELLGVEHTIRTYQATHFKHVADLHPSCEGIHGTSLSIGLNWTTVGDELNVLSNGFNVFFKHRQTIHAVQVVSRGLIGLKDA